MSWEFIRRNTGYFIAVLLALFPVILWSWTPVFQWKFADTSSSLTSLGQLSGLVGMAFFSLTLILSSRLRVFEKLFYGINRAYIAHHLFGGISFLLLMIHPLLLAGSLAVHSFSSAAVFLLPGTDWTVNLGRAALLSLMLLLIITYYIETKYELWRFTHQFMGAVFFLGGLHMLFIPSDVSVNLPLRVYMVVLSGAAITLYSYRTLLGRFLVKRASYTVSAVKAIRKNIFEITLIPQKKSLHAVPGQFVFASFSLNGKKEIHPFSISSGQNEYRLSLTVKSIGDFTRSISSLKPGMQVLLEGPFGYFSYLRSLRKEQIWVAGGIGITPFLSMVKSLSRGYRIDLYYCVGDESEAIRLDELQKISRVNPAFRVFPVYSSIHGRLQATTIRQISGDVRKRAFFLCGPPMMMSSLKRQLRMLGVGRDDIHTEEFALNTGL